MKRIFISYRRKSSAFTLLMANALSQHLEAKIFIDFKDIDQDDFERAILTHLHQSDVFLLMVTEHTFSERIHHVDDWVRREIQEALGMNIPLVLVCENGQFPPSDLPDEIRGIAKKQGIKVYSEYFDAAVDLLVKFLGKLGVTPKTTPTSLNELPVPEATIASLNEELIPQTSVTSINAQHVLEEALHAYDQEDFAQSLSLLKMLQYISYHPKKVDALVKEIQAKQAQIERKSEAQAKYDEIAIYAKHKTGLKHALEDFWEWAKQYPDLIQELDTLYLHEEEIIIDPLSQKLALARQFTGKRNKDWKPIIVPLGEIIEGAKLPEMEMCLVPVGTFTMGNNSSFASPPRLQTIDTPYWIALYPVTNAQWRVAERAKVVKVPRNVEWYNDPKMANCPVVYVDWYQALAFSEWAGCTLPSELETEYAARGVESSLYPWGNNLHDGKNVICNNNSEMEPNPVTSKVRGASWVGARHLSGNVWEWQRSMYKPYPYNPQEKISKRSKSDRVLRGGSFSNSIPIQDVWQNIRDNKFQSAHRDRKNPSVVDNNIGFRCALSLNSSGL